MALSEAQKNAWMIVGGVLLSIVGLGAIGLVVWQTTAIVRPVLSKVDLCVEKQAAPSHTLILIDQSTQFTTEQVAQVRAVVERERNLLPRHARLTLLYLTPETDQKRFTDVLSLCSPGTREDVNMLYEDPEYVQRKWDNSFAKPMEEKLQILLQPARSDLSLIVDAIRAIALREDFRANQAARRLVILSDMKENSHVINFYDEPTLENVQAAIANLEQELRVPDLAATDVRIDLLQTVRGTSTIEPTLKSFWLAFFDSARATNVEGLGN